MQLHAIWKNVTTVKRKAACLEMVMMREKSNTQIRKPESKLGDKT